MTLAIKVEITEKYIKQIINGKKLFEYRHLGKNSKIIFQTQKRLISMGIDDIIILSKKQSNQIISKYKDIPFNPEKKLFAIKLKGKPQRMF